MAESMVNPHVKASKGVGGSKTPKRSEASTNSTEEEAAGPSQRSTNTQSSKSSAKTANSAQTKSGMSDSSMTPTQLNKEVFLVLRDLNNNYKVQNERMESQNQRIDKLTQKVDYLFQSSFDENGNYEYSENINCYSDYAEASQIETEGDSGVSDQQSEPPFKKQKTEEGSVFRIFSERFQNTETVDPEINDDFASFINNAFRSGISDEKQVDMWKAINRPINCDSLVKTRVNQGIWRLLKSQTQTDDSKMQIIQNLIIKSSVCITKLLDKNAEAFDSEDLEWGSNALALLGQANKLINNRCKEAHKSDLDPKYHYLTSSSLPYTDHLYGDDVDVNKNIKEINDMNRIGKGPKGPGQRGFYSHRGRRPFRRSRGRGRGFQSQSSNSQSSAPKNPRLGHKK